MALETEHATYRAKLLDLIADGNTGKFALIKGADAVNVFNTYEDAIKDGYTRFGLEPFLVRKIETVEHAHFVSRLLPPCLTSLARERIATEA